VIKLALTVSTGIIVVFVIIHIRISIRQIGSVFITIAPVFDAHGDLPRMIITDFDFDLGLWC
jgi:hypothetical protein